MEIFGLGKIYRHALAVEFGSDEACLRLESEIALRTSALLNKSRETTRTITAHFPGAAITIIECPRPIGFPGSARNQQNHAISSDSAVPITQADNLVAGKLDSLLPIINEHKVIPCSLHLDKFQNHGEKLL